MYQAPYFTTDGSAGAEVTLPAVLFDGVINEAVLHQAIRAYLANQRQGTANKKNRSAVAGGSRKPWRQKGTGRARQGTIRAVQWRGGGLAFPPRSRSWNYRVPKRVRALARRSAFNSRAVSGRVVVIEGFDFEAPKTRRLTRLLEKIGIPGKVLVLTHGVNRDLYLSGRNIAEVRILPFGSESPYDVLWSSTVIIEEAALGIMADLRAEEPGPGRAATSREPAAAASEADGRTDDHPVAKDGFRAPGEQA